MNELFCARAAKFMSVTLKATEIVCSNNPWGRAKGQILLQMMHIPALRKRGEPRYGASPIVDGNDLSRETGLPPGPRLGMLKGWLYRRQVEDDLTTFDEVIGLLDNFNWENSEPTDWGKMEWP